jgi:Zn-dependent protease with chaperone function
MKLLWFLPSCLLFLGLSIVQAQDFCLQDKNILGKFNQWEFQSDALLSAIFSRYSQNLNFAPAIHFTSDTTPSATTNSSNIIKISSGLMYKIDKREELAFVIAHEVSHLILGHTQGNKPSGLQEFTDREIQADQLALQLLKEAKIDISGGLTILSKFENKSNNLQRIALYPTLQARISQLSYLK